MVKIQSFIKKRQKLDHFTFTTYYQFVLRLRLLVGGCAFAKEDAKHFPGCIRIDGIGFSEIDKPGKRLQICGTEQNLEIASYVYDYVMGAAGPLWEAHKAATSTKKKRRGTRLQYLAGLKCPILLSRVPDMKASVGKMLSARQVPRPETLEKLNKRIDAWASERKNVVMVPMAEFVDDLRAGKGVSVSDIVYPPGSIRKLLQRDELHPTLEGLAAVTALSFIKFCESNKKVSVDDFERRPLVIRERVIAAIRAAKKQAGKLPGKEALPGDSKESEKDG